ncbi:hypothetical protein [Halobacterium zhouii]|uniref:hypothetical protein n=1 Tax=Halobacterium zhouii TaxID=2902624 RepID=UPI001E328C1D|nr:hypothetical protein [Halobacterium zhouii]
MTERTMRDVSQRNPAAPEHATNALGRLFQRGPSVAADGGERGGATSAATGGDDEPEEATERTMRDVDKTPSGEGADANRVWERGGEASARSNEGSDRSNESSDRSNEDSDE